MLIYFLHPNQLIAIIVLIINKNLNHMFISFIFVINIE
jgi:hypothetical protein